MTSAPIGGYEPSHDHGELGTGPADENSTGGATEVAKDQAAQVGQTAKESGQQVASTAADEAKNVTAEARRHAKDLTQEAANQAQQQASVQKDKAASGLHSLGDELRSMAENGGQSGPVTDLAHQAADKVTDLAAWIEGRDPGALLEEVRRLARRKPGTFLLGAAAAGIVAGRLTRGVVQAGREDKDDKHDIGSTATGHAGIGTGASHGSWAGAGSTETIGEGTTPYADEATPIADLTEADARLAPAPEPVANDYEPAGRPL